MGLTTTFHAVARSIAARIADGDLDFPADRACSMDRAAEALLHFAGMAPAAPDQVIEDGGAEIVLFTQDQVDRLRTGLRSDTFLVSLDDAPADLFVRTPIHPFGPADKPADARDYLVIHAGTLVCFLDEAADENLSIVAVMA